MILKQQMLKSLDRQKHDLEELREQLECQREDIIKIREKIARIKELNREKEHWAFVYDELIKCPMFSGIHDATNGDKSFMHGVGVVMDYIAYEAGKIDEFDEIFYSNLIKSEEKAKEKL